MCMELFQSDLVSSNSFFKSAKGGLPLFAFVCLTAILRLNYSTDFDEISRAGALSVKDIPTKFWRRSGFEKIWILDLILTLADE